MGNKYKKDIRDAVYDILNDIGGIKVKNIYIKMVATKFNNELYIEYTHPILNNKFKTFMCDVPSQRKLLQYEIEQMLCEHNFKEKVLLSIVNQGLIKNNKLRMGIEEIYRNNFGSYINISVDNNE